METYNCKKRRPPSVTLLLLLLPPSYLLPTDPPTASPTTFLPTILLPLRLPLQVSLQLTFLLLLLSPSCDPPDVLLAFSHRFSCRSPTPFLATHAVPPTALLAPSYRPSSFLFQRLASSPPTVSPTGSSYCLPTAFLRPTLPLPTTLQQRSYRCSFFPSCVRSADLPTAPPISPTASQRKTPVLPADQQLRFLRIRNCASYTSVTFLKLSFLLPFLTTCVLPAAFGCPSCSAARASSGFKQFVPLPSSYCPS